MSNRIIADPSKAFFIDMLTRDITLVNCVLDLLDNSLHSLVRTVGLDVMRILQGKEATANKVDAEIDVAFGPTKFSIIDSCGGISIDDARNAVFRLGNANPDKTHPGLGVYGIGLKRAMFKIGRKIEVKSNTMTEEFRVIIDVDKWEKQASWDLEFDYAREKKAKTAKPGSKIEVTRLNEGVKNMFGLQSFGKELRRRISTTFALFLKAGVVIRVNGKAVSPDLPEFAESADIETGEQRFKHKGVEVLVMAGLTPKSDRNPRGWYVFCNGRMVLEANKESVTGWGDSLPGHHVKFNHFLGYVYFKSNDANKLPLTTTKEGVERESPLYQKALGEMRLLTRPVLDFLNRMYPTDIQPEGVAERETLERAGAVSVETVATKKKKSASFSAKTTKKDANASVNIVYKRAKKDIDRIRRAIKKPRMSATKIGEHTFDVFLRRECD